MADAKLNAVVTLSDRMSRPLKGLNKQLRDMQRPFKSLTGQVRQLDRLGGFKQLRQGLGGVARIVGRGGIIGGTALVGGFSVLAKSVVDISAQFEKYQAVLTSIEGSSDKAKKSMSWVQDFASTTPFQLDAVMQSFVSLKTFGLDPMDGTMQALIDSSAKMGGSQEHLQGIILAVGQAWTKGKLQGEEALQLIERGIPVWDLLAKASNKTAGELQELSSKGKLGRDAINQLIKAMGASSIGASAEQMKTWNGLMSNLVDQWDRFKLLIGSSGIFDVLRDNMKRLLDTVDRMANNGQLKKLAESISDMMISGFNTGKAFAKELIPAMKTFVEWIKIAAPKVSSFVKAVGGFKTVAIAVAAVIAGPLLGALATLSVALLTTPVGWAILAIAAAITGVVNQARLIKKYWKPVLQWFSGIWESVGNKIDELWGKLQKLIEGFKNLFTLSGTGSNGGERGPQGLDSDAPMLAPSGNAPSGNGGRRGRQGSIIGGRKANNQVSGSIDINIDSEGRPRVRNVRTDNNDVDLNVYAGMSMVGR